MSRKASASASGLSAEARAGRDTARAAPAWSATKTVLGGACACLRRRRQPSRCLRRGQPQGPQRQRRRRKRTRRQARGRASERARASRLGASAGGKTGRAKAHAARVCGATATTTGGVPVSQAGPWLSGRPPSWRPCSATCCTRRRRSCRAGARSAGRGRQQRCPATLGMAGRPTSSDASSLRPTSRVQGVQLVGRKTSANEGHTATMNFMVRVARVLM